MSDTLHAPQTSQPELLVSIRDAEEAALVLKLGVPWIDLKDPAAGALGAADEATCTEVAGVLNQHPQKSAALGELRELSQIDGPWCSSLSHHFSLLKVGLSHAPSNWQQQLAELSRQIREKRESTSIVPVIYADWANCAAASPADVLAYAVENKAQTPFVLIDTFAKDGLRLLDHLALEDLEHMVGKLRKNDIRVVLAGSLNPEQIAKVCPLAPAAIGVRGAVCDAGRQSAINATYVQDLLCLLAEYAEQAYDRR